MRTGWPVGRVLYAEAWRPSIYDDRCRPPPAIYPRTRAGRPRSCARPVRAPDFLILLQVGFAEPAGSPRSLVVSCTAVSPLPSPSRRGRRSVLCGTFPRVAPGGCYPPPRPVEPGPSSALPEGNDAVARPAHPRDQDRGWSTWWVGGGGFEARRWRSSHLNHRGGSSLALLAPQPPGRLVGGAPGTSTTGAAGRWRSSHLNHRGGWSVVLLAPQPPGGGNLVGRGDVRVA